MGRISGTLGSLLALGMVWGMSLQPAHAARAEDVRGRAGHAPARAQRMQDGLSRVGPWLFQELDLTQEQRRGIRRIRQQHMEGHQAVRDDLKAKERALYQAMLAADSRREDAERMQREVSELRGRLALARVQGFFEMRSLLTPEQLARLSKITKAGKGRRGKRPSAADGPSGAPAGTTP